MDKSGIFFHRYEYLPLPNDIKFIVVVAGWGKPFDEMDPCKDSGK